MTTPALNINREPVCWANEAPNTRSRDAFKWERVDPAFVASVHGDKAAILAAGHKHLKADGEWHRVRSTNDRGEPLVERIPQGAQYGTPITGLTNANLRTHVRVLRHDGVIADVRVTQGAAHEPGADVSFENYMLNLKGRKLGWIRMGQCPAAMTQAADERGQLLRTSTVLAPEVVLGTPPCRPDQVGLTNPPCKHFTAEHDARMAKAKVQGIRDAEIFKSEEAKLLEGQAKLQREQSAVMTAAIDTMAKVVDRLDAKVTQESPPPTKGDKK